MHNNISLVKRCSQLLTITLLCFSLLTIACARVAPAATVSDTTAVILGFKHYYGDPPKQHLGVDVAYEPGANLYAPVDGTISFLGRVPGSAGLNVTAVTIEQADGSLVTLNPFASTTVTKGDAVSKGQLLGTLSSVGDPSSEASHAHLSLRIAGIYRDPSALIAPALDESKMAPAAPKTTDPTTPPGVRTAPSAAVKAPVIQAAPSLAPQAAPAASPAMAQKPVTGTNQVPATSVLSASAPVRMPTSMFALAARSAGSAVEAGASAQSPVALSPQAAAPLLARVLDVGSKSADAQVSTSSAGAAPLLISRFHLFLAHQSKLVSFSILFAGALLLSATAFGLYQAGRQIPGLVCCARALITQRLQSAMRGVTMVSRTFLLRTKPSSFGATSPKEVIQ